MKNPISISGIHQDIPPIISSHDVIHIITPTPEMFQCLSVDVTKLTVFLNESEPNFEELHCIKK